MQEDAVFECGKYFLPRHARVDGYSFDPPLTEILHLVLHQADKRAHHHGYAGQQKGGQLVADRLARPGGHHGKNVPPGQQGIDHFFLPGAEAAVTEDGPQDRVFLVFFHAYPRAVARARYKTPRAARGAAPGAGS